ncbi:hypothetical protein KYY02_11400 [Streptomyces pimonensis]|uniref:Uncharacterized protein n=1 Tax=Streptomyces pimonensis TaxID=2860288 RepID=A0ABV4IX62_9ACTN
MEATPGRPQPEAARSGPLGGRRTCLSVVGPGDGSRNPPVGGPFLAHVDAEVGTAPVTNAEDPRKGLSAPR